VNRWRALFGAAVLVSLLVGHLLRDTPGYMVRNPDGSLSGDMTHYVYWTRLITQGGIQSAYHGTWPETYAVYPPLTLLPMQLAGSLYQRLQDPTFDLNAAQQSLWLRESIKFAALAWHVLTAAALFLLVRKAFDEPVAAIAASLYVLNPAALYDVAHWAQPDGAHSLFSVLAVGLLDLGQVIAPWAAIAAAALAKPQAWFLVPLLAVATLRMHGVGGVVRGAVAGAIVAVIISLPFVLSGRIADLLSLPMTVSTVMPVVSADAHNLWWLIVGLRGQDPLVLQDSARALGPLSYRTLGAALVAFTMLLTCWLYWTRRAGLAEVAALGVLGWFVFTTQAHENHLFFALPLLSLAWPGRPLLLIPFAVITVTLLLNMLLHDQLVLEALGSGLYDPQLDRLRLFNAALNVACLLAWATWAVLRTPTAVMHSSLARQRARLAALRLQ
jgi:Gpi18-like mannosyltransferase